MSLTQAASEENLKAAKHDDASQLCCRGLGSSDTGAGERMRGQEGRNHSFVRAAG